MKNTIIKITSFALLILASMTFVACSTGTDDTSTSENDNIFDYAIDYEDYEVYINYTDFLSSYDDVLADIRLDYEELTTEDDYGISGIIKYVDIDGLSDDIKEVFGFADKTLYSVSYQFEFDADDYEAICEEAYNQAIEFMPEEDYQGERNISAGDCSSIKDGYYLWSCFDNVNIELSITLYEDEPDLGKFSLAINYNLNQ